jgi:hypothetical protein
MNFKTLTYAAGVLVTVTVELSLTSQVELACTRTARCNLVAFTLHRH